MRHLRQTHTYSTLGISQECYDHIREKLLAIDKNLSTPERKVTDYQDEYFDNFGQPDEVIVFGTVGLIPENRETS